jgi:hypothetical protein
MFPIEVLDPNEVWIIFHIKCVAQFLRKPVITDLNIKLVIFGTNQHKICLITVTAERVKKFIKIG